MENILVTGSSGFVGSHLVNALKKNNNVICLTRDIIPRIWTAYALTGTTIISGSLGDFQLLRRIISDYGISRVYHLGAQAIVSKARANPIEAYESTVMGTVNLLEACRLHDVEKTTVLITDKIFGNKIDANAHDPYVPTGIYETSKICQDATCKSYADAYGMKIARVRTCNQYGLDYNSRIIPNTMHAIHRGERPVIYRDRSRRQYMYVEDLVSAMLTANRPKAYNFGTPDFLSQEKVVHTIIEVMGSDLGPVYADARQGMELVENSLATSEESWTPQYSFRQGIEKTLKLYSQYGW